MKNFKQFLENYDVYLDKPLGFKKPETEETEETDEARTAQEEQANEVRKG